jgi:hypothetical protein
MCVPVSNMSHLDIHGQERRWHRATRSSEAMLLQKSLVSPRCWAPPSTAKRYCKERRLPDHQAEGEAVPRHRSLHRDGLCRTADRVCCASSPGRRAGSSNAPNGTANRTPVRAAPQQPAVIVVRFPIGRLRRKGRSVTITRGNTPCHVLSSVTPSGTPLFGRRPSFAGSNRGHATTDS